MNEQSLAAGEHQLRLSQLLEVSRRVGDRLAGLRRDRFDCALALGEHFEDLQDEAYAAARDSDDKYLEATLKESMRLHPVIASTARKLTRDQEIGGWKLPAGTVVNTSIPLAHQRPDNYPDTWTYRPDRFVNNEVEPNTWLPFGGGVRRCIGAGLSLMEGTAVLREILTRYTLAIPVDGKPERGRVRNITNVPRRHARVAIAPRLRVGSHN